MNVPDEEKYGILHLFSTFFVKHPLIDITNYRLRFINVPDEDEFFILLFFSFFVNHPFVEDKILVRIKW